VGVPILLVVEDNIRYYSSILPVMYTELISQSRRVIREGINVAHKLVRQARTSEDFIVFGLRRCGGAGSAVSRESAGGGFRCGSFRVVAWRRRRRDLSWRHLIRELLPDVPTVLHSSHTEFRSRAHAEGFSFLQKRSPTFLRDFRRLLTQQCAFGDFVFRTSDGAEVARASDMTCAGSAAAHRA